MSRASSWVTNIKRFVLENRNGTAPGSHVYAMFINTNLFPLHFLTFMINAICSFLCFSAWYTYIFLSSRYDRCYLFCIFFIHITLWWTGMACFCNKCSFLFKCFPFIMCLVKCIIVLYWKGQICSFLLPIDFGEYACHDFIF